MVRLVTRSILSALAFALVLAGCGVKGALVPAKKGAETGAPRPPESTTAPEIPSASPNSTSQQPAP